MQNRSAVAWALGLVIWHTGASGGLWLGRRIPKRELRWAMVGLLVVLAVVSIVGPVVG